MDDLAQYKCISNSKGIAPDKNDLFKLDDIVQEDLTVGKIYTVLSIEKGWYRVVDDSGEDYLYPGELFKKI